MLSCPLSMLQRKLYFLLFLALSNNAWALTDAQIASLSLQVFSVQGPEKAAVVEQLVATGDTSLIPTLVLAMRWTGSNQHVANALSQLTGDTIVSWHDAFNWQEQHPEVVPHNTFRKLKLRFLGNTDQRFLQFFETSDEEPHPMSIRLEEIVWGGALYEGIPSLDFARMVPATEATYLKADDLVFGVSINGDSRAYPLRIMGWHEMLNDVVGGVPVALAYCTLCGSAILYGTDHKDQPGNFSFGTSGLLYRSNKLMFDRQTHSLWNQFTGKPVSGSLLDRGITLTTLPLTITSWEHWLQQHEETQVLSLDTGFVRDYGSGVTYAEYFNSPDLMFPAVVDNEKELALKDYVFSVTQFATSRAWPLSSFEREPLILDQVGTTPLVLIGNAATRSVRAYERGADEQFEMSPDGTLLLDGTPWQVHEEFLKGPGNTEHRARLPGHVSFWFAWQNFTGGNGTLYEKNAY